MSEVRAEMVANVWKVVAAEGEQINGRSEISINSAFGVARLLVCAGNDAFPDRWFLG